MINEISDTLQKANQYLDEYGVFDGHNDLPMTITYYNKTFDQNLSKVDLYEDDPLLSHTSKRCSSGLI